MRAPELTLKGRNQKDFLKTLKRNVAHVLRRQGVRCSVSSARGRLYVETRDTATEQAACGQLSVTPGVDSFIPGYFLHPRQYLDEDRLQQAVIERELVALAALEPARDRSFAIKVNRLDKSFPMDSEAVGVWLGDSVRKHTDWQVVDLDRPARTLRLDIFPDGIFLSDRLVRGVGGLPVGSSDRVLALLSGGIDSPVACALMAKRGCSIDFLHMSVRHPRNLDRAHDAVVRLAARLSRVTQRSRLLVVPYGPLELALARQDSRWDLLLFRRFLVRLAELVARTLGAKALVTGDSLGQVASQTLDNLISSSRAGRIETLRPLIGFNKQEIITLARRIGTYETSIEPHKDCCALFEQEPATRSRPGRLRELERQVLPNYDELLDQTLREGSCLVFDTGSLVDETRLPAVGD